MKPKAFVLYPNQWKALKELSLDGIGFLFTAIYRSMNGEDTEDLEKSMPKDVLLAFRFLKIQIDIDYTKYLDKVEKNKERQERFRQSEDAKKNNALKKENDKDKEKETENENENENEKENENESDDVVTAKAETAASQQQNLFKHFEEAASRDIMPWINDILKKNDSNIPRLRRMTESRVKRLFELQQEYGNHDIGVALRHAATSPFLNGRGKRNKFVADIDWVISKEHFLEVLEGKYNV